MSEPDNYQSTLVSVIMPAYNAGDTLDRAITSVLSQSYSNIELLVVNDCSTDTSQDVLSKYAHFSRVRVFKNDINQGVSSSRKLALQSANGRYIAFLDADDFWEVSKIEKQINFMRQNNYGICFFKNRN